MLKDTFKYFVFPNAFNSKECRKIIKSLDKPYRMRNAGYGPDPSKQMAMDDSVRKSMGTTVYKSETEFSWIRNRMLRYCHEANEVYKTKITDELTDDLQLLKYGPGGHFIRHCDSGGPGYFALRELSIVLQLSSPKEYKGGELLLQTLSKEPDVAPKEQGTLIVFQSCLFHQVMPVTKGVRYSMVAWVARRPTLWDKIRGRSEVGPHLAQTS